MKCDAEIYKIYLGEVEYENKHKERRKETKFPWECVGKDNDIINFVFSYGIFCRNLSSANFCCVGGPSQQLRTELFRAIFCFLNFAKF